MDKITLDFDQAKAKHLLFKSRLRSILYGLEVDEKPVISHFECAVGKWIYDHALKAYSHIPEVTTLEKVHEELHTTARRLVELYRAGKVEESRLGLNEIEKIAFNLVQLLDTIELKLKQENSSGELYQGVDESIKELTELSRANELLDAALKNETTVLLKEKWLLQEAFMQIPASISILKGREFILQFSNPAGLEKVKHLNLIGKSIKETFPELGKQGYFEILEKVYETGEPYVGKEMHAVITIDGKEQEFYNNVSYSAIKAANGETDGILSFSYDVTDQVKARKAAEEAVERIKQLHEDVETKVKFRNIELEKENASLRDRLESK